MADNTILLPGGGGDVIATDDVGGVKYERVKVNYGVDGSATDVSASNPLPVALTGTQAATPVTDNGGTLTVDDGGGSITVDGTVSISGALDSELTTADLDTGAGTDTRAVVGLVRAESGGGTLVGSANPLPVSGTVTASGPLTDTQLRATPVPVSGTVTADTELPAAAALADATANPTLPSIAALGLLFNGTTWDRVRGDTANGLDVDVTRLPSIPTGANTIGKVDQGAAAAQAAAWPTKLSNGTINADVLAAAPGSDTGQPAVAVRVVSQLGAGSGLAGTIDAPADNKSPTSAQHVQAFLSCFDGTNWDMVRGDTTNGVDVDVTRLPALPAGTNNIGDVDVLTLPAIPTGANTIGKVDQGAPATAANGWPVKLTDGTNNPAVKAASTPAAATDPSLVVALHPTSPLPTGTNVLGTVLANGDVDHDAVNTAKVVQVGGHTSPADLPPTLVSAAGDRARNWVDRAGAQVMRRRKIRDSYTAIFRLAETTARLDLAFTFVANTNKQLATLHHTVAASTKEVRLMKAWVVPVFLGTATGVTQFELKAITGTPATGNPAITPALHRQGGSAAECVALTLPTTGGTEAAANSPLGTALIDYGIESGTAPTANPVQMAPNLVLYDANDEDDEELPPILRTGTLEGFAIVGRSNAAVALRFWCGMRWTEEIV